MGTKGEKATKRNSRLQSWVMTGQRLPGVTACGHKGHRTELENSCGHSHTQASSARKNESILAQTYQEKTLIEFLFFFSFLYSSFNILQVLLNILVSESSFFNSRLNIGFSTSDCFFLNLTFHIILYFQCIINFVNPMK